MERAGGEVFEVPKTLIFAKTDSHAEDIIEIVREEFAEENKFCKKITYRSEEDPKTVLSQFRNDYYPRIAVTVDMIATGTDIRPLEVLVFMRDVKSRSYYEQMKGRGTRTCSLEQLKATGTPTAKYTKDHFVIIDAIGVESTQKTDSRPLERAPGISLKELLDYVKMGNTSEDMLTTLANRLLRLEKQISEQEKIGFAQNASGFTINHVVKQLLNAHDPDTLLQIEQKVKADLAGQAPALIENEIAQQKQVLIEDSVAVFHNPDLRNYIVDVRKKYDQIIDTLNIDEIAKIGWVKDQDQLATKTIENFSNWIAEHKDEITALQLFYGQAYQRRELTYKVIKELYEKLKVSAPNLAPMMVWKSYEQIEKVNGSAKNELVALVALIRRVIGLDETLTAFDKTVDTNFKNWVFKQQAGSLKFTEEQMNWLRMIKDYVANSFHVAKDDFELDPFNKNGGLGKMWQLFGDQTESIIEELNEVLAA